MFDASHHLTDEALWLQGDRELSRIATLRAQRHLRRCVVCQTRKARLVEADARLAQLRAERPGVAGISHERSRAHLRARLDVAQRGAAARLSRRSAMMRLGFVASALLLLATVTTTVYLEHARVSRSAPTLAHLGPRPVPDAGLTPGATRSVKMSEICSDNSGLSEDQDPEVPPSLQRSIFQEYGMTDAATSSFQVDYLISPQLGGTNDIRNLWPQPYGTTVWNARAKDALESRLHQMVCRNEIDLQSAQRAIATDWIAAYQKVFGARDPM